jgi:hypothetical protein
VSFTFNDMLKFATEAFGPLGADTVRAWGLYNDRYFDGALKPIPLVFTRTMPFGRRVAFCSHSSNGGGRTITVNVPDVHLYLLADKNGVLLHEMIHQFLFERGESAGHSGEPWRREIIRLHKAIAGHEIWAGRSKTARQNGKVVRINKPHANGRLSLSQGDIARWPHSVGLKLGPLGSQDRAAYGTLPGAFDSAPLPHAAQDR